MAQRPFPLQWARQSAGESQDPADGSRLIDCYAVNPAALPTAPDQPKVPVALNPRPSRNAWLNLPGLNNFHWRRADGTQVNAQPSVNGLALIDSPVYGRRLVGVCAGWWWFEAWFGGPAAGDPAAGYDGRSAASRLPFTAARFQRFTGEDDQAAGRNPVRLATDHRRVIFVSGRTVFAAVMHESNPTTFQRLMAPTPDDQAASLPDEEWVDCAWLDGFFLLFARNGQFFHSNHNSLTFDQLDFATAETKPDETIGAATFQRRIWVFGSNSIEVWYNAGGADFAFKRDVGFNVEFGCAARDTIQKTEYAVLFLGSNGMVYAVESSRPVRVSHEGLEKEIRKSDMTQARAFTYTEEGHVFYSLTLSTGANWTFDLTTRFWAERSEGRVLAAVQFSAQSDVIVGRNDALGLEVLSIQPFRPDGPIRAISVSPQLFFETTRTVIHSVEIQTNLAAGESIPEGTATLQMSHTAGDNWEPPDGQVQPIAPTMRFNRLGQDRLGLGVRFRLILNYTPVAGADTLQVLGAYATASAGLS